MIGVPNSQNLNYKVHVLKGAPGTSVLEEIADIFRNYHIDYSTKGNWKSLLWLAVIFSVPFMSYPCTKSGIFLVNITLPAEALSLLSTSHQHTQNYPGMSFHSSYFNSLTPVVFFKCSFCWMNILDFDSNPRSFPTRGQCTKSQQWKSQLCCSCLENFLLTHWGSDKMAAIFQKAFPNAFLEWKCMNFD